MKLFFSEMTPDYTNYTFPHAVYAQAEDGDLISQIYNQGFLPYSADLTNPKSVFYLCRSLRIDLSKYKVTSENRRVDQRKPFDKVELNLSVKDDWSLNDQESMDLLKSYISARFPDGAMSDKRLRYILDHPLSTHSLTFKHENGRLLAIIIGSIHQNIFHYWFAFFDHTYLSTFPIGKWVMWRTIKWASNQTFAHVYLGTCYYPKSLYKARDFKGVEFFDGYGWNSDVKELKRRVHEDNQVFNDDRWRRDGLL